MLWVHRILEFVKPGWLANYMNSNNECANKLEKDFNKLTNNAVFGKLMFYDFFSSHFFIFVFLMFY